MPLDKSVHQKYKAPVVSKPVDDQSRLIAELVAEAVKPMLKDICKEAIREMRESGELFPISELLT